MKVSTTYYGLRQVDYELSEAEVKNAVLEYLTRSTYGAVGFKAYYHDQKCVTKVEFDWKTYEGVDQLTCVVTQEFTKPQEEKASE